MLRSLPYFLGTRQDSSTGNYPNESNDQERPPTTKTGPGNNTRRYGAKVTDEQIQEIRKLAVEEMKRYRLLVKFGNIVVGLALGEH